MHRTTSIAHSPERPRKPAEPLWSAIPPELIKIPRWVLWRYEVRSSGWTKVPLQPDRSPASSTDETTWAPFDFVESAFSSGRSLFDGIGIVLNRDGLIGFDFDHCVSDGRIVDLKIENYVRQLDSYTEVSPSGTGLRVFLFAKLPPDGRKSGNIECYETGRYLTVTGCHYPNSPGTINYHQGAAVEAVHASVFAERIANRETAKRRSSVNTAVSLADSELLERARKSKNGADFIALYDRGAWKGRYTSQSEADLALCTSLAFWCRSDPIRIDRLLRSSALMRRKWERADYRDRTIAKAIEGSGEVYLPEKQIVSRGASTLNFKGDKASQEESPPTNNGNDAEEPVRPPQFSDDALALQFANEHAARLRYVAVFNDWLEYDGACWRPDRTMRTFDRVRANNRQIAALASTVLEPKIAARICPAIASNKTVAAVYNLARSDRRLAASVEQWDSDPWLLNTPTGVVDLRSGQLRPHQLSDYLTKMTVVGPAPAGSDAPVWSEFLDRIFAGDRGLIAFVQRAVGYALTGSVRDHAIFFMYGTGANGKSVLVNTVRAALGAYATSVPMDALTVTPYPSHPTELADLAGARLVYGSETEEGRRWAEARIKQLTGGDPIKARKMRQDFFEYQPQFKLFVAGNHKPSLTNVNEAIRRRLHLIPFEVTIPPAEQDRDLTGKLTSELSVILSWAIDGCLEWQRIGLAPPSKVMAATNDYLASEDTLAQWIGECCSTEPNDTSTTAELFANWKSYAERAQERAGSQKSFVLRLEDRKFERWRCPKTDRMGFSGIRTIALELGVNWNATQASDNHRGGDVP